MPGTSYILPFAQGAGANVLSQTAYNGDAQRPTGNQPGAARGQLVNKAMLQASVLAAAVAQFVANWQGNDITDQLTISTLASYLTTAIQAAGAGNLGGANQSLHFGSTPGYQKFPGGIILQWGTMIIPAVGSNLSNITITFPLTFPQPVFAWAAPINAADATGVWPVIGPAVMAASTCQFTGSIPNGHSFNSTVVAGYLALGY